MELLTTLQRSLSLILCFSALLHPEHATQAAGAPSRWVETLSWEPRAFVYHGFLSEAECDHVVALAEPTMARSSVVDAKSGGSVLDNIRTSHGTFLKRKQDDVISDIERRISLWTKLPERNGEDIQVLRYQNGQKYDAHWDWFDEPGQHEGLISTDGAGNRVATVLMYLSDVEEGGETAFPHGAFVNEAKQKHGPYSPCGEDGISVKPKKGDALLFWNLQPNGKDGDKYSLHAGCPVLRGTKWSATKWIHVRPFGVDGMEAEHEEEPVLAGSPGCRDEELDCEDWAIAGECDHNPGFMHLKCKHSCNRC
uniref:procollagen-proline 4-dioxygenase n=1 Tax=Tetraselmis chuii TaxID=63592 RepID=A0A6U1L3D7_9CHLO